MGISDRTLEAFLTLSEFGTFTTAAQRCNMTQSALSQLIARLEDHLHVRLFERGARAVRLTPEGERFAVSAKRVMHELNTVRSDLRAFATRERGEASVAALRSLATYLLPRLLRDFKLQHPQVRLQMTDTSSAECYEMARNGLVDFALGSNPGEPGELVSELLFEEKLFMAIPASHPFAGRPMLSLEDLDGLEFISIKGLRKMMVRCDAALVPVLDVLRRAGVVCMGIEAETLATVAGLVEASMGSCIAPWCSAPQFSKPGISMVLLDPERIVRPIYASWRKGFELSTAATALLTMLKKNITSKGYALHIETSEPDSVIPTCGSIVGQDIWSPGDLMLS